jgi:drug/metabolite transporter (DMT)-like permease
VSPTAIALILVAAVAHASWNLLGKQAATTGAVFFIWLVAASASVIYAPVAILAVLAGHPHLTGLNWLFLAGTGILQSAYFVFLQLGYRLGDLSVVYPIGRGTGALLAAVAGIVLLGERPTLVAIAGIAAIVIGVAVIGLPHAASAPDPGRGRSWASGFAVLTGMFIAGYTIWDKYAVATLRTPPILQGYASFPIMVAAFAPFVLRDRARLITTWHAFRPQALGAGLLAPLAYILVLAALSFTAVSAVAPAREISVLIGVLLGRRLLAEGAMGRRLAAATAIVAGILAIAIG